MNPSLLSVLFWLAGCAGLGSSCSSSSPASSCPRCSSWRQRSWGRRRRRCQPSLRPMRRVAQRGRGLQGSSPTRRCRLTPRCSCRSRWWISLLRTCSRRQRLPSQVGARLIFPRRACTAWPHPAVAVSAASHEHAGMPAAAPRCRLPPAGANSDVTMSDLRGPGKHPHPLAVKPETWQEVRVCWDTALGCLSGGPLHAAVPPEQGPLPPRRC